MKDDQVTSNRFRAEFPDRSSIYRFAKSCVVPFHIDGRTKLETEKWQLSRYLIALADAGRLKYPIIAEHAEQESQSPDWIIHHPGGVRTGLEVTEASSPGHHIELINNERGIDNHYELRPGSVGDEQERLWVQLAMQALRTKAQKLANGRNWRPADAHDLVIYDNGPAFVMYPQRARALLRDSLVGQRSGFRTVSIITKGGMELLYDIENEFAVLPLPMI